MLDREAADRFIAQGNLAENEGRLSEACALYGDAVKAAPGYARAHVNLGIGLEAIGDADGARRAYEAALEADASDAYANYNLAKLLHARGELERGARLLQAALERKPDFPEAHVVLASIRDVQGDTARAADALEAALRLRPDYAGAWHNYGVALAKLGRLAEAETALSRAVQADPAFPLTHQELGKVAMTKGALEQAAACFRKAVSLQPTLVEAHMNLCMALWRLGRLDDVIAGYQEAQRAAPSAPAIPYALANALVARGRLDEAVGCYRQALQLKPDFLDALCGVGTALRHLGRHEEATAYIDAACRLAPDSAEGWYRLAYAFRDADRRDEGLACLGKALLLDPEYVEARWALAVHQLPALCTTSDEPARRRAEFDLELDRLDRWFDASRAIRGFAAVGTVQPFLLAYQEADNRDLLQRHGRLCARLMDAWAEREGLRAAPARQSPSGAVRVGVISSFFSDHSVWNAMVRGWFGLIDRERVALHAFYLRSTEDDETRFARSRAARFESGARDLRPWVEAILQQRLDVLIYPEVGMDEMTLKLAGQRLAPTQVAAWGHPVTTGLPTIDFYLSAQDFEPADAQAHYTERLVALPHLGCYYSAKAVSPTEPDLEEWGIDPDCGLFICPGVPFKYTPQHDALLAEIARRAGHCRFIFFTFNANPRLSHKLRQRLELAFAQRALKLDAFVTFVPWQNTPNFYGLLRRAAVFLDTIGFSGFNTAMHAVACGLPIVTREGRFMRGRLASGILKRMGLAELVAASDEAYVSLAVRLMIDPAYRARVRERMQSSRAALFEDPAPIRAMQDFLIEAARRPGRTAAHGIVGAP